MLTEHDAEIPGILVWQLKLILMDTYFSTL